MLRENSIHYAELMLTSPDGTPSDFDISVINRSKENQEIILKISLKNRINDNVLTNTYTLNRTNHNSYLDLFEKLTHDFGMRLPQNRLKKPRQHPFKAKYQELILANIHPDILYGYGDPAVLRVDNDAGETCYYLLATSNDAPESFPILYSKDLKDWNLTGFVFSKGQKPAWAVEGEFISDYWAPEMQKVGDEFRAYFVARHKDSRELCIGMARALNPAGPFIADEEPVILGNVIDPHIFVESDGKAFIFWKKDNNDLWPGKLIDFFYRHPEFIHKLFEKEEDLITTSLIVTLWPWIKTLEPMERFFVLQIFIEAVIAIFDDFYKRLEELAKDKTESLVKEISNLAKLMKTPVYAQQLSDNGSSLIGTPKKILENDMAWEAHLVEGIWVTKHDRKYYLFYAGNDFSTHQYGIGLAVSDSLMGPYIKMPEQILQSTEQWWAPGHPSVVTKPDGETLMFLHAFFPEKAGYKQFRALLAIPLKFNGDTVLPG